MNKIIGIDPDIEKCGVCELVDGKIKDLYCLSVPELIDKIVPWCIEQGYRIGIENTLKVSAVYSKNRKESPRVNEKIANSVGKVQGVTKVIIDYIYLHTGEKPLLVPAGVGRQTKNKAGLFRTITGWERRTNEDMRDAYAIAIYSQNKLAIN